ncbi:hypothetical protein [Pseudobutyrivibrio sp.]|uniref:hypothetical protein n=1 Tax=Pseudobutyrivibrio sp. TaxID=2014367 RepID=UPI001DF6DE01|nr:hypothetical protein [Pseudobutyrivibrio sp.]MBE5911485.1 hypothetical protein [Pseudobutyrivibrio sp.]
MGKKKVQDLIKGVVITGTAVGGASVFSDMMGLSVAQTVEASTDEIVVGQNAGEAQEAPSQDSLADSGAAGAGQENASGAGEGAPVAEAQQKAVSEQPAAKAQSDTTATDETTPAATETQKEATTPEQPTEGTTEESNENPAAPTAETHEGPTDEQISESAQASLSQEESTFASTSEFQAQSLYTATSELSDDISATENEYADDYELYVEDKEYIEEGIVANSDEDVALSKIEEKLDERMDQEQEIREATAKANKTLPKDYYNNGRELAVAMIQYKLTLNGTISSDYTFVESSDLQNKAGVVSYKYWNSGLSGDFNGLYQNHNICLKYVDVDGVYHEEYYDEVTCDSDGKSIIRPLDKWVTEEEYINDKNAANKKMNVKTDEDNPKIAAGINVLKKEAVYGTEIKKVYNYLGQKITTYKRIGWNDSAEYNYGKGADWYSEFECKEDIQLRSDLLTLPETTNSLKAQLSEVENSASASAVESQSASQVRQTSLSASAEASTAASEAKSEAISQKASELASTSASSSELESASVSASASEVASTSSSTSASEYASASASTSASEYASASASTSLSTSESVSASESASASESTATETEGQTTTSASERNYAAASGYVSNVATAEQGTVPTDVYSEEMVFAPISNDQVPLAVLGEDLANEDATYMAENNMDIVTTIDEDEVAKGVDANGGANVKRWFASTLPVIGTLATLWGKEKLNNTEKNKRK